MMIMDIYAAGELPSDDVSSQAMVNAIRQQCSELLVDAFDDETLLSQLANTVHDGDVLLMQGAGNIGNLVPLLLQGEAA